MHAHAATDRDPDAFGPWRARLLDLCAQVAADVRAALLAARGGALGLESARPALDRPAGQGRGDVTFGLDLPAEHAIQRWAEAQARAGALSVLTEDAGWRHLGPDGHGGWRDLDGFDHGGPRIALDPVDGTRNLMTDLRSAWTVVSFAPSGPGEPRLRDLSAGLVAELPTTRERSRRIYWAQRGGACTCEERATDDGSLLRLRGVRVDASDRPDHGYFPFFRYQAALRPALAAIEADFLGRLERFESADVASCYDDQYITNAGQLVLLMEGVYRVIVDARPWVAARLGRQTTTAKPYDVAGAIVVAEAAGCVVGDLTGAPLDFALDCATPVAFAGWVNPATRQRLLPHLAASLAAFPSATQAR